LTKGSAPAGNRRFETEHGKAIDGLTIHAREGDHLSTTWLPGNRRRRHAANLHSPLRYEEQSVGWPEAIQAKAVNEENEKTPLRNWLTRLGKNVPNVKMPAGS
jgi:hypothetical protein